MSYDDWKLDTPDNHLKHCATCVHCNDSIYVGEDYILTTLDEVVHFECFDQYALSKLIITVGVAGEGY